MKCCFSSNVSSSPFFFPSFLCRNGKRSRLKSGCQALNTHWGSRRSCQPPFSKPGGCWEGVVGRAVLPAPPLRHHQHYKPGEGRGRGLGGGWGKGVPCGSGSQTAEKPALLPRSQESKTNCGSEGRRGEPGAGRWHCPAGAPAFGISVCPGYHLPKQPWTRWGFWPPQDWHSGAAQDQPLWRCRWSTLLTAPGSAGSHLRVPHGSSLLCLSQVPLSSISFLFSRQQG